MNHRSAAALARMMGMEDDEPAPRPLAEAQIATLREIGAAYASGCRFKVGDIVMPRPGMNTRCEGVPHYVAEIPDKPIINFDAPDPSDSTSSSFGRRADMRVIVLTDSGTFSAFWVESWEYIAFA